MNSAKLIDKSQDDSMTYLRVDTEADNHECKISIVESRANKPPTEHYVLHRLDQSHIQLLSEDIYTILNSSLTSLGNSSSGTEKCLKDAGRTLYHTLFPLKIKEQLAKIKSQNLLLIIHDSLVGIPWECLYDGNEFFCLRFNMGRMVYTSCPTKKDKSPDQLDEIKMLIIANPTHDLPSAYNEGLNLHNNLIFLTNIVDVSFDTKDITISKVSSQLLDFNILHYAGHATYSHDKPNLSGWHLLDGILTPQHIIQLSGDKGSFPSLIFANACQSGQTKKWVETQPEKTNNYHIFDLVNTFLRCGVQHYIGTFGFISDPFSHSISASFYNFLFNGCSVGGSLRKSRLQMIETHGKSNLVWAHYGLYGDPTTCYFKQKEKKGDKKAKKSKIKMGLDTENHIQNICVDPSGSLSKDIGSMIRTKTHSHTERASGELIDKTLNDNKEEKKDKKWNKKISFVFKLAILLLLIFIGVLIAGIFIFRPPQYLPLENYPIYNNLNHIDSDFAWENKKWEIVEDLQEKLNKRFPNYIKKGKTPSDSKDTVNTFFTNKSSSNDSSLHPYTLCIIPENPMGIDSLMDKMTTKKLIGELMFFFSRQTDYIVVERERLDFILKELTVATSNPRDEKLKFTLGKIFGARGILLVLALKSKNRFSLPFINNNTYVHLRLVETETTAIKVVAEKSFNIRDIHTISKELAEEILHSLKKEVTKQEKPNNP